MKKLIMMQKLEPRIAGPKTSKIGHADEVNFYYYHQYFLLLSNLIRLSNLVYAKMLHRFYLFYIYEFAFMRGKTARSFLFVTLKVSYDCFFRNSRLVAEVRYFV